VFLWSLLGLCSPSTRTSRGARLFRRDAPRLVVLHELSEATEVEAAPAKKSNGNRRVALTMGTARKGQSQGRPTLLLARLLCSRRTLAFVQYRTRRLTFPFRTTIPSTHRRCQILQSITPLLRMTSPIYLRGLLSPASRVRRLYHGIVTQDREPCLLRLLQFVKPHGPSIPRNTVGNPRRCSSWMNPQLSTRVFIRQ